MPWTRREPRSARPAGPAVRRIALSRDGFVGRDPAAAVLVADARMSRRHAWLRRSPEGWLLEVLPSVTHEGMVKHNGHVVARGQRARLAPGDALAFGSSPEHTIGIEDGRLLLEYSEDTAPTAADLDRLPRVLAHPADFESAAIVARFEIVPWADEQRAAAQVDAVDAILVRAQRVPEVATALAAMRDRRFFLPIAVHGTGARPAWPRALRGEPYLWLDEGDPEAGQKLLVAATIQEELERQALPFRTGEVLHVEEARRRVLAHDWTRDRPREIALPDLHHRILVALAVHQRQRLGSTGLTAGELAARLEHGTAELQRELAGLADLLPAQGLHPLLFQVGAGEPVRYGLSTPPHCLRDV